MGNIYVEVYTDESNSFGSIQGSASSWGSVYAAVEDVGGGGAGDYYIEMNAPVGTNDGKSGWDSDWVDSVGEALGIVIDKMISEFGGVVKDVLDIVLKPNIAREPQEILRDTYEEMYKEDLKDPKTRDKTLREIEREVQEAMKKQRESYRRKRGGGGGNPPEGIGPLEVDPR